MWYTDQTTTQSSTWKNQNAKYSKSSAKIAHDSVFKIVHEAYIKLCLMKECYSLSATSHKTCTNYEPISIFKNLLTPNHLASQPK